MVKPVSPSTWTGSGPEPDRDDVAGAQDGKRDRVVVGVLVVRFWLEQGKFRARISSTADVERAVERVQTLGDPDAVIAAVQDLIEEVVCAQAENGPDKDG